MPNPGQVLKQGDKDWADYERAGVLRHNMVFLVGEMSTRAAEIKLCCNMGDNIKIRVHLNEMFDILRKIYNLVEELKRKNLISDSSQKERTILIQAYNDLLANLVEFEKNPNTHYIDFNAADNLHSKIQNILADILNKTKFGVTTSDPMKSCTIS